MLPLGNTVVPLNLNWDFHLETLGFRAIELIGKEGFAPLAGMIDPYQAENEVAATLQRQVGLYLGSREFSGAAFSPIKSYDKSWWKTVITQQ